MKRIREAIQLLLSRRGADGPVIHGNRGFALAAHSRIVFENLESRVLLSAVYHDSVSIPPPAIQIAALAIPTFTDVTSLVGLDGAGGKVAFGDYNGDGWVDLYSGNDRLWRNDQGQFTQVTGVPMRGSGLWADYNNDGYLDLYGFETNLLFHNVDGSSFEEQGMPSAPNGYRRGATWSDFNNDGFVDLYGGGYETPEYQPDFIFLNNQGSFFSQHWVQSGDIDPSRGITAADYDEDGDQDVYVSNYRLEQNQLWQNDGHANFTNVGPSAGVAGVDNGWSYSYGHTIGSAWGDLDSDGHLDLFVGNFSHTPDWQDRPKFYRNLGPTGDYKFEDRSGSANLEWQESYATPALGDFDNDGYLDLFLTTVYPGDSDVLYRNNGDWSFSRVDTDLGAPVTENYGAGWADIDNDGDLDLLTAYTLYRNNGNSNNWLKVHLEGDGPVNRAAIGTQVRVALGNKTVTRQVEGATGEGNQNDLTLHFGLGQQSDPVDVQVTWPNGEVLTLKTPVNQTVAIRYGQVPATLEPVEVNFNDPGGSGPVELALYSIAPGDALLHQINPFTGSTINTVPIVFPDHTIKGGMGLATHPVTSQLHALLKLDGQAGRELVVIDPKTGEVDSIGDTGLEFVDLTFDEDGTLYAVTGDAASTPETLYEIDLADAGATEVVSLGNGNAGETIAFNSDDGLIYHASGSGIPNFNEIFETINSETLQVVNVELNGFNYNKAMSLVYSEERAAFLSIDFDQTLYAITPDGQVNSIGSVDHRSKGLAFVPDWPILRYDTRQEDDGAFTVDDDGATLRLTGNKWVAINLPYEITANTVFAFDFASSVQGDVHSIGFDDNLFNTPAYRFNLYGTQQSDQGHQEFNDYMGPGDKHYTIPVGSFFTGSMDYITFVNDHDVSQPSAESVFSNVRIYEQMITYPFFEDFDNGTADHLEVVSGSGEVNGLGRYEVAPLFDAAPISVIFLGEAPDQLAMSATMTIPGEGTGFYHGVLIFDYRAVDDFKFAGSWVKKNEWRIGHVDGTKWVVDARTESDVNLDTSYELELVLDYGKVTLSVDGQKMVGHDFSQSLDGSVGLGAKRAVVQFDNITIGVLAAAGVCGPQGPGTSVPGDFNCDGVVDIADLGIVGANFNTTQVTYVDGDANLDNVVDVADLGVVGANWSVAQAALLSRSLRAAGLTSVIPEQATVGILGVFESVNVFLVTDTSGFNGPIGKNDWGFIRGSLQRAVCCN